VGPRERGTAHAERVRRSVHAELWLGVAVAGIGLAQIDWASHEIRLDAGATRFFDARAVEPLPLTTFVKWLRAEDVPLVEAQLAPVRDPLGDGFAFADARTGGQAGATRWLEASVHSAFAVLLGGIRGQIPGLHPSCETRRIE
jgi:hypothetical protein